MLLNQIGSLILGVETLHQGRIHNLQRWIVHDILKEGPQSVGAFKGLASSLPLRRQHCMRSIADKNSPTFMAQWSQVGSNVAKRDGKDDPHNRFEPMNNPVLDEEGFKLTGIPYIKAEADLVYLMSPGVLLRTENVYQHLLLQRRHTSCSP